MPLRALISLLLLLVASVPAAAQRVTARVFGKLADGRVVHEYLLDSGTGLRVRLLDYGGIIRAIEAPDRRGRAANVVLSFESLAAHEKRANFSSIIGRYANRLSGDGVTIDGVFHKLAANEKGILTHGGSGGFGAKLWQAVPAPIPDRAALTLRLASPAGENGFPGALVTDVTFSVSRDRTLRLDYRVTSDAPTVVNLTHHAYFNLAGAGTGSIDRHWMRLFADRFTPVDASRLPTGEILPVAGTAFDFRVWAQVGPRMRAPDPQLLAARGLDHNFVLRPGGKDLALAACLYDPDSGRAMLTRTDQPGVQIYTANGFDGSLIGGGGQALRQSDGVAIETQHFPDSPRHPGFPSTVLRPGKPFLTSTSFTFLAAAPASAGARPSIAGCDEAIGARAIRPKRGRSLRR